MDHNRLNFIPQYVLLSVPFWLSLLTVCGASLWFGVSAVAILLLFLWVLPICRGRQSLFAFLLVTAMGVPLNIRGIAYLWIIDYWEDAYRLSGIFWSVLLFVMLLSVEQIAFGILVRFLWPRQYRRYSCEEE